MLLYTTRQLLDHAECENIDPNTSISIVIVVIRALFVFYLRSIAPIVVVLRDV